MIDAAIFGVDSSSRSSTDWSRSTAQVACICAALREAARFGKARRWSAGGYWGSRLVRRYSSALILHRPPSL